MSHPKLVLYIGEQCFFCKRVVEYLVKNPFPVEIKDVYFDDNARKELKALTGRTQVPCLQMDNEYMFESLDIIEKIKELQSAPT